jgi:glycosyltransferase involved in cell wall biosynthesis
LTAPARVLVVAKGLGRGGTERLLVSGLRHLDRQRFDVEVAYVLPWKDALVPEVRAHGVPVQCLGAGTAGRFVWPMRLRNLIRRGRFDIVHTHMPSPAAVARLSTARGRPAMVHTEHNVWQRYRRTTYWANAVTYHRNAAVLAVSGGVAESIQAPAVLRRFGMPKVEVLIHGIDSDTVRRGPDARTEGRRLLGLARDVPVIGTVGNLAAKKDQASLLQAVATLTAQHPNLRLVLIGSGPLEAMLRRQADDLGLGPRVIWAGSRDDVPLLLPAFDLFVLSSRHEGLSIALIEALATGLPCVATNVGGIPEVVDDGHDGILVHPGQPEALAAAMNRVLTDDDLRRNLAERGAIASKRFQLAGAMVRIQEVYDEVLAAR